MKKLIKRRLKAVVSFIAACTVLCSAATEALGVQAQLPAPVAAASADIWKPDDIVYPEGITLHKEVTGSTGSRKEGNLAFDLKLGMKAEQNPIVAPSDIVLVLDRSGSMDTDLKTILTAQETPDTRKTYYVTNRSGNSYEVTYSGGYWQYKEGRNTTYVVHETDPSRINTGSGTKSYPYRYQFYTKESRMDALKTAAKDFIDRVAAEAERYGVNHRIDLISYSSNMADYYNSNNLQTKVLEEHTNGLFVSAAQEKQTLKSEINSMVASGGTYTNAGLAQAIDDFNNSKNQTNEEKRKRVVVLFTDGAPTGNNSSTTDGSDWNIKVDACATDAAKVLKAEKGSNQIYQKQTQFKVFNGTPDSDSFNANAAAKGCGASVYVVGVLDQTLLKEYGETKVNGFIENIASSPYENFYENCKNVEQLNNMFQGIIASSVTINLNNSTVREYIDPKFELTAASIEALKKQGAVVSKDGKGQYVEWTLKVVTPGEWYWFKDVQIRPKDETAGNFLPTNIDGDTSFQTQDKRNQWPFPLPHVNVPADPANNPLKTDKVSVVHGDDPQNPDRMYDVIMKAWGDKPLAKDFDFTLVLDKSGSMGRNRARVQIATSRDELQYLNKAANNYDICQYAWYDSSSRKYYPVRYNDGKWQWAQYNSFTNATGAVTVSASRWYTFDTSKITESKPLFGYKWALLQKSIGMFLDQLADQVTLSQDGSVSTHAMLSAQVNIMDFAGDNTNLVNSITNGYENVNTSTLGSIKNKLFSQRTNNGSTPTDEGLKAAYNALKQGNVSGNGHQKVVILFTDGVPGSNATAYSQVTARSALNYAEQIRALPDTSMYAIGLFGDLEDDAKVTASVLNETKPNGWQGEWLTSRDTVDLEEKFMLPMVGGEQEQYLRVTSSYTMESIFIDLSHKFSQYTLRDYIDPRFYPVDKNGNRLEVGAVIETGVVAKGATLPAGTKVTATLKLDKNGYYFEWTGQELPSPTNNPSDFWTQTIMLKAKETFIGGNDIPTNIGGISGVYTYPKNPAADIPFPEPTVNVPVRFEVGRTETTIFLGESVPTNLPKAFMFDSSKVSFKGDVFINPTDTGEFRYEWIRGADTPIASAEQFPDGEQPRSDVIYTLAVTFVPKHDDSITSAGLEVEDVRQVGLYTVHVVSGSIKINKQINLSDVNLNNGDPIFVFCLQRLNEQGDVVETKYDYVRFDEETVDQQTSTLSVEWRNLSKGTYRVVEQKALRYAFDRFGPVTSNGAADSSRESVTFQIGLANLNRTVLPNGEGTFVNKKTLDDYFTDTDIVNNQFEIVTSD